MALLHPDVSRKREPNSQVVLFQILVTLEGRSTPDCRGLVGVAVGESA
jgi:hypothetical protein